MKRTGLVAAVLLLVSGLARPATAAATTSCLACHGNPELFPPELLRIVGDLAGDVHARAGLSCHDCHGGNPDPGLSGDRAAAKDPGFAAAPYRGSPERGEIPGFCGHCHSDPAYMRRFRPDARVDQEREYWTSHHGRGLERGDPKVATCVDCHGVHGILASGDPRSPVYATRVAETCRSCHSDPARMRGYVLPDGRALPVDQYARWRQSVHARALVEREDLSAPTCNDCHGNHGAAPPGLDSVAFVCGQCHPREAELFRSSPKQAAFRAHNLYLEAAGEQGCGACHLPPEPQAGFEGPPSLGECTACHGNHAVVRPTIALLSPLPDTPCFLCHEAPVSPTSPMAEPEETLRHYRLVRDALLEAAASQGLAGDERFDWLVDQAQSLPMHTLTADGGRGERVLRPEFARLFAKFRIGKTHYTYDDPVSGQPQRARVIGCDRCHAAEPLLAPRPVGRETAAEMLRRMQELTARTASAERVLLRARRGGVEVRPALLEIDRSVDAQIELQALVHSFAAGGESEFARKHREGLEHAQAALEAGERALGELAFRRRGLAVFLVVVLVFLTSLALAIRRMA